jgi:hypothetical protein
MADLLREMAMRMKILVIFTTLSITGCSTSLGDKGEKVNVVEDKSLVEDCKFLKSVESSSSWGGLMFQGTSYKSAMNELKNNAGEAGANMVLISRLKNNFLGSNMMGAAYKCP